MLHLSICLGVMFAHLHLTSAQIEPIEFRCGDRDLFFTGKASDFPRYEGGELSLGLCSLNPDFSVTGSYLECGFTRTVEGDLVTFSGVLASAAATGTITRRKKVSVSLSCSYNRVTKSVAQAGISPNLGPVNGDLKETGDTIRMYLSLLDNEEQVGPGGVLAVEVGTTVHFEAGFVGSHGSELGMTARVVDCWTTPTPDPSDPIRYALSAGNCALDETLETSPASRGRQLLSFESFAFSHEVKSHLYLHCNLVACNDSEDICGVCAAPGPIQAGESEASRKRRSVTKISTLRPTTLVTKDIRMK